MSFKKLGELTIDETPVANSNNLIISGAVANLSNPNLLINGDFSINQRNITSLTGTNTGYMVDRWRKGSVNSDVSFSGTDCTILINVGSLAMIVGQTIEAPNMVGKKITASINITNSNIITAYGTNLDITFQQENGTYISGTNISLANKTGLVTLTATVPANTGRIRVSIMATSNSLTNETITFDSPKLEIGEIATPFSPRPYAEELALCQRYYQRWNFANNQPLPSGIGRNTTTVSFNIPITEMRPYYSFATSGTVKLLNESVSGLSFTYNQLYQKMLRIFIITTGIETSKPYLIAGETDGYFAVDAEIY